MRARRSNEAKWGVAAHAGLALLSVAFLADASPASAQQPPPVGIVCTDGVLVGTTRTFTLVATTGYISAPDGNVLFMWGFSEAGKPFQHPGPVLCANEGETVTVILNNTLAAADVSIIFPGQENVLANGAPAQPQFNASNALVSLTNGAARAGGSVTYGFFATRPGTFLYESGTEPQKQVRMGLFGALLVRPTSGADFAYNRVDSQFTPGDDFLVLLSEVDPYLSRAVEAGKPFNMNDYRPRYWFVNGRGFPDSIADNGATWLPSQPYGALARIYPKPPGTLPGMIRYLNLGTEDFPFHPHGNNGLVIGRDGNPLEGASGEDLSFEKFAVNIGPGQTWDVIFRWWDAEGYTTTNPLPVTLPNLTNLTLGMFYGGSPYLGSTETMPPGVQTLNQCGEYYIISHNHALHQLTAWGGVVMVGPITYLRIDPPLPNNCTP